jgi:signal transduction histidine kinase
MIPLEGTRRAERSLALRLYALVALLSVLPLIVCAYLVAGGLRAHERISVGLPDRSVSAPAAFPAPQVFANGAAVADAPRAGVRSAQYAGLGPEAGDKAGRPPVVPQPVVPQPVMPQPVMPQPVMPSPIVPIAPHPSIAQTGPPGADPSRSLETVSVSVPDPSQAIFWEMPEIRVAVLAYLVIVALAVLVVVGVLRSLNRFRRAADEIALGRVGDHALVGRSGVRELASVAGLMDRLVFDLRYMSDQMKLTAEENAHSLRTPLATIRTALCAVRRALPPEEPRAQRALKIIDNSLDRVSHVVNSAQRNDTTMADLVAAPRADVDLAELARDTIVESRERAQFRNIRIRENLKDSVLVRASVEALEAALEDVLASAINASPSYGEITVTLEADRTGARLLVEDRGGSDEADLVFQHDFTPVSAGFGRRTSDDSGPRRLGLWSVKRTVEAFGGEVGAQRKDHGGVVVSIMLPSNPR